MIHVVDAAGTEGRDPIADIRAIMKELEAYDPKLLEKPQVIAANKMDAVYGDENEIVQSLRQEFEKDGIRVFPISAVSGKGLKELLYHVQELLDNCGSEPVIYEPEFDPALRFFKEDYPELHVIAAGSLLEFTLQELPTFGVGRIHSMFMYPMTFDEFLVANQEYGLIEMCGKADCQHPLDTAFHNKLVELFRIYLLVGGMPEAVLAWVKTRNFINCRQIQEDIVLTYEDDFSKYKKRANPDLLRVTMRGVCHQIGEKLTFRHVPTDYETES